MNGSYSYTLDGSGVSIYVVDTGVSEHSEILGRRVHHDRFGTVGSDCAPSTGHGTAVASVAAGTTLGVARGATMRVLDALCGTGQLDRAIAALEWIRTNHGQYGRGVVNLSWGVGKPRPGAPPSGGGGDCPPGEICMPFNQHLLPDTSRALDLIINDLVASGVTVVAAAGNSNADACRGSPGRLSQVITVAASDQNDSRWYLDNEVASNYGSCVDLFAPGHQIESANKSGGTSPKTGTSLGAPFVAGVVALYLEEEPGLTPAAVKSRLLSRATQAVGLIANPGTGSPYRLLFSLVPVTLGVTSPSVVGPGQYRWTANLAGGIGHPTYQWARRWVYPDGWTSQWEALGSGSELLLDVHEWEPHFEIRVNAASGFQSASWSHLVTGHCGPPWMVCIESSTVHAER